MTTHPSTRAEDQTWVGSGSGAPISCRGLRPRLVVSNRFEVGELLGCGGAGLVYEARHLFLHSRVALKVLRPELGEEPGHVERFAREARCLAALSGDHVVRILDAGRLETGLPFLVMERLEGVDLRRLLSGCQRLPVPLAVEYARQACAGLAEAHALKIVHGDIKPANLFLASDGAGRSRIKLIDFGIASSPEVRGAAAGSPLELVGSPGYAAPEQYTGAHELDARTDLWALGIVLYEMLAGASPFEAASGGSAAAARGKRRPPLAALCPGLDPALSALVERCLAERKRARPGSAAELAEALAPFGLPRAPEAAASRARQPAAARLAATLGLRARPEARENPACRDLQPLRAWRSPAPAAAAPSS